MAEIITLKLNKEFKRAYFWGKFKAHPFLVTYRIKNSLKQPRIGITASKKIGGAVERNRARRLIRTAFRLLLQEDFIEGGYDYVFVARPQTAQVKMNDVLRVMKKQISVLKKC